MRRIIIASAVALALVDRIDPPWLLQAPSSETGTTPRARSRSGTRSGSRGSWPSCTPPSTTPSTAPARGTRPTPRPCVTGGPTPRPPPRRPRTRCWSSSSRPARRCSTSGSGRRLRRPGRPRRGRRRGTGPRRGRGRARGARRRRLRRRRSIHPRARARGLGAHATGLRADARAPVPERHALHLRDRTQFLPDPPPALTGRRYARDYTEVKLAGQDTSQVRTPDQTHTAHFWAEPSPAGWSRIGNLVSSATATTCTRPRGCRRCSTWRWPTGSSSAGIRSGCSRSGARSPRSAPATPTGIVGPRAIRPGCPSARPHPCPTTRRPTACSAAPPRRSCAASRARTASRRAWSRRSSAPAGTERCWNRFTRAELENAESRVLAGFHFRFAIEIGIEVGRKVGRFAIRHALKPLRRRQPGPGRSVATTLASGEPKPVARS